MTIEQAREIIKLKDVSTKEKQDQYLKALNFLSGSAFRSNGE